MMGELYSAIEVLSQTSQPFLVIFNSNSEVIRERNCWDSVSSPGPDQKCLCLLRNGVVKNCDVEGD